MTTTLPRARDALLACREVAPWTSADARAWWDAHGAALRARRDTRRTSEAGTERAS